MVKNLSRQELISGKISFVKFLLHKAYDIINQEDIKDIYNLEEYEEKQKLKEKQFLEEIKRIGNREHIIKALK